MNPNASQNEILVFWPALKSFTLEGGCCALVCSKTAPEGFGATALLREGCLGGYDCPHPNILGGLTTPLAKNPSVLPDTDRTHGERG